MDLPFKVGPIVYQPVQQAAKSGPKPARPITEIAQEWVTHFNTILESGNSKTLSSLFQANGFWKDHLSTSWEFHTVQGHQGLEQMAQKAKKAGLSKVQLDASKPVTNRIPAPAIGESIMAPILFETPVARGKGVFTLTSADDTGMEWKCFTLYTVLYELKGHEERKGATRPRGYEDGDRTPWSEKRRNAEEMQGIEPYVMVIGAGHAGCAIAARLGMLDIPTLVIERNPRVGDSWRKRYPSLVLHDPVWYDQMPYLPFPENWPTFTPKDKFADWLESYAKSMELNIWTETSIQGTPTYDSSSHTWTVHLSRPNGSTRVFHPHHIILATGTVGNPHVPQFPGATTFKGPIYHSSNFPGGHHFKGQKAVIIGACNSAHDIAQEFHDNNSQVTIVQRSSTTIISHTALLNVLLANFNEDTPTEYMDMVSQSMPGPVVKTVFQYATGVVAQIDKPLLEGLEKVGFKLDYGYEGTGLSFKAFGMGGGYYIDVGCSKLIIDGKVKVKEGQQVDKFVEDGVVFADGTKETADVVVLATGYGRMRDKAREIFGDAVMDKVSPAVGFTEEESGQEGLWFMGYNLAWARYYSRLLALQIKAAQLGLH